MVIQLLKNITSNPKIFGILLIVLTDSIPSELFLNDESANNSDEIVNLYAKYFGSLYEKS